MHTGISVDFYDSRSTVHGGLQEEVWQALAATPAWDAWLRAHYQWPNPHTSMVSYEQRARRRIGLRAGSLICREPVEDLLAAVEAGRGEQYFADLFRAVYVKWAERLGVPMPPVAPYAPQD